MPPRVRPPHSVRMPRRRFYSVKADAKAKKRAFEDPRASQLDIELENEFAVMRETYSLQPIRVFRVFYVSDTQG
jgi:hypothetical protein